ncbi:MAG: hypothetical protein NT111_00630 [Patescibacteria group bacterium]|jgi:hypothetical protein|nr:hypothetical protein [Patescibacteria group bacterium]
MILDSPRDQQWLESLLDNIWANYFSDVQRINNVHIKYGRIARRRLGSIGLDRQDPKTSVIIVNRIFMDLDVPEYVIIATIVHELTHYAHGFNSPHEQKHLHPHSGGIIRKEFAERGLEEMYLMQKKWLKANWAEILTRYFEPRPVRAKRTKRLAWWLTRI